MEEHRSIPIERTGKIFRRSVYTFLQNYQYFTTAALLAFPFSASVLLSQALLPSSPLLPRIHHRLHSLFDAAGFPPSSELFTILNLKLSQTITSSILVLPFTLSFLLIAKASVIQALNPHKSSPHHPSFSSIFSLYNPLILTQLCTSFLILSAHATCFSLLFFAFNSIDISGYSSPNSILLLSAAGAVVYSIILANAFVICNLALVSSGMEKFGGYLSILKACVLIRGRTATALSLALPVSMALAAVEALFQYRVMRAYRHAQHPTYSMALEGMFIAYLYSILIVLDTVVGCLFFRSCKTACQIDIERRSCYRIETVDKDASAPAPAPAPAHGRTSKTLP